MHFPVDLVAFEQFEFLLVHLVKKHHEIGLVAKVHTILPATVLEIVLPTPPFEIVDVLMHLMRVVVI